MGAIRVANKYDTIWDKVLSVINSRIGSTVTTRALQKAIGRDCYIRTIPNYMCRLRRAGFVERVKRGKYKVIKPCNHTIVEITRINNKMRP